MPAAKKTVDKAAKQAVDEADAIHEKRDDYDNPPVDTPVPIVDAAGEVEGLGDKAPAFVVAVEGSTVRVTVGKTSVVLDREGVLAAKRHFDRAAAQL